MQSELYRQLTQSLAVSNAVMRKVWAREIIESQIPLENLFSLLHGNTKTAQRFTWLLGDICELEPKVLVPYLPLLFSLRNQMPFPGMDRSLAKWLWLTGFPESAGRKNNQQWIEQIFEWIENDEIKVACKSFAAKGLYELAKQKRVDLAKARLAIQSQTTGPNKAFSSRMKKLHDQLHLLERTRNDEC